jgi:carbamoyl-phosphate synthase small subunit
MAQMITKAVLLLQDGTVFHGYAAGKIGTTTGEICFNTSMTGYQEVFTDPSYHRQILVATNVHIGNYGITSEDQESSSIKIAGLVVRNFSKPFSRNKAETNLEDYFIQNNLVAITGVDTRALVNHLRKTGSMNAIISSETTDLELLKERLKEVPDMNGLNLVPEVTGKEDDLLGEGNPFKVAMLDYGFKANIAQELVDRGCEVKVFPAHATAEEIQAYNPVGLMLSNGPGDPATLDDEVAVIQNLVKKGIPTFGICLGHQLLGRAFGISTYKMKFGHRGINQPVLNLMTGLSEITSQNHGFALNKNEIDQQSEVILTHVNLNDESVEGIKLRDLPAFSVQFHPESNPGPHDSKYLFDHFVTLFKK